jgi:hypothetical protein
MSKVRSLGMRSSRFLTLPGFPRIFSPNPSATCGHPRFAPSLRSCLTMTPNKTSKRDDLRRELELGAAARRERQKKMDMLSPEDRALLAREAGQRLASMGGTMPGVQRIPRRRPPNFLNK